MLLRDIKVGDMIEVKSEDFFREGLILRNLLCSIGIAVQVDEIITQIYWQNGKYEWFHTFDLNTAVNVEII